MVSGLKNILKDNKSHMKNQHDLIGKYKQAMEVRNDHTIKSFISKDNEREKLTQLFKSEFPLVKETLFQS